ncbi:flagellar hook protein FlgE [Marasmitruncus massiliensis]|uniref:flagellar hook protein FlgE n=1 Tax=Marasmitruncus massiliensis TaxID=1944642 RepID=UPI000C7C1AC3|nr:flagellar hook-basal body complex protein [Marasmitruncus massiliensis]
MVRSLYAGVTGMKAHQIRMDVIGNNIANVNTYGFKSSRATFRDVYYQSLRGAAAGSNNKGGLNPSEVGYGSTIGSIDVLQTQSTMSTTGNPLDIAITGEGFLQVQDADGNIYYTKAGMLDIDSNGNLIDSNGNFVLGTSGNPVGKAAGSSKITFNIPSVDPAAGSATNTINGIKYTVKSTNQTSDANVTLSLMSGSLPLNQKAKATVSSTGISVTINKDETFANLGELQSAVNAAIKEANGGVAHPAGDFIFQMDPADSFVDLTGAQITSSDTSNTPGKVPVPTELENLFEVVGTGDSFSGTGKATWSIEDTTTASPINENTVHTYHLSIKIGTKTYESDLTSDQMKSSGQIMLGSNGDTITVGYPSESSMLAGLASNAPDPVTGELPTDTLYTFDPIPETTEEATATEPSKNLGLGSQPFKLENGTVGGAQTVKDLTGISIGADGVVRATHPNIEGDLEIGRIDLVTFDNPQGLAQVGNTYFAATANSGDPNPVKPGEEGSGAIASSALEMSNVDLSQEFADMITTQRGFQANSRLITVSDTMLEELINLKR